MDSEYVAWFINGEEVYRQTASHIGDLVHPAKIMMNIWNPTYDDWVGIWDDRVLPRFAYYDWSDMPRILLVMEIQAQEIILRFNGKMILMNLIIADGK